MPHPLSHWLVVMSITWCALGKVTGAQRPALAIDPHVVVLTRHIPMGRVTIFNPHATATKFSVYTRFGTIVTDARGESAIQLADSTSSQDSTLRRFAHNASTWISAYPKRFILNPGASQVVRLIAHPPRDLADGEYWARLVVHAQDLAAPLHPMISLPKPGDSADASQKNEMTGDIRLGVSLETSTILPIFYRTGLVSTGVAIDTVEATIDRNSLHVRASLKRTGNSAYIGLATLTVCDSIESVIARAQKQIAVYDSLTPRWTFPLTTSTRPVKITLILTTNRPDAPPGTIIKAPAQGRSILLTAPSNEPKQSAAGIL